MGADRDVEPVALPGSSERSGVVQRSDLKPVPRRSEPDVHMSCPRLRYDGFFQEALWHQDQPIQESEGRLICCDTFEGLAAPLAC
jgi:hypothetical protein